MVLPKRNKEGEYYLSYSQISSFLRDKKDYFKKYFFNEPIDFTAYIDFGSKVGVALETNDFTGFDPDEQETLKKITRLDEFEREIRIDFDGFHVIGYIDTNSADCTHLIDYKTGNADKVSEYTKPLYIQPHIYALGIEQKMGFVPDKFEIHLIERYGNAFKGEKLSLGKEINIIPMDLSREKLNFAKETVIKTAQEISEYYQIFTKINKSI